MWWEYLSTRGKEEFGSAPGGGKEQMWILGIGFAILPFVYGLWCCVTLHAHMPKRSLSGVSSWSDLFDPIDGLSAFMMGASFVFLGLFFHFHWYWSHHPKLFQYFEIGKLVSLIGLIASLVLFMVAMLS